MPHSGGGGSHGGGSHGGSHGGGSSGRTSHTYFPGARRYRRRYHDGRPDEYFYSNGRPQKTGLSGIIAFFVFALFFSGIMFFSIRSEVPKRLDEEYRRPSSRVIDNIDVIGDEDRLEDALEEFNDMTGICPIVYTMYVDDYRGDYADLEEFAYHYYVDNWSDEQHYLVVYAIPENEADAFRSGELEVPDYQFEIMMGDDTDAIITESIEDNVVDTIYDNLEDGKSLDRVFTGVFNSLTDIAEDRLDSKSFNPAILFPIFIVGLFFILPIILMIKAYIKDKNSDIDEVPLTEQDDHSFTSSYTSPNAGASAKYQSAAEYLNENKGVGTAIKAIYAVFLIPFVVIGISMIIRGVAALASGNDNPEGLFTLVFGLIWSFIVAIILVSVFKGFKAKKPEGPAMTAEYPKADMPHSEYPYAEYPQQEYNSATHDDCRSSHEEDEDSIRKGYE